MTLLATLFLFVTLSADGPMKNDNVRELIDKGLPTDLIVAMIKNAVETDFDTSTETIIELRDSGFPNEVLIAMVEAAGKRGYDPTSDNEILVYVSDSLSWSMSGGFGASYPDGGGGYSSGGARPQTAEIIKTFGERGPDLSVTNERQKADYVVLLDHEGGKWLIRKDNKVAVFDHTGQTIYSGSTRSLGNAVKDGCNAIRKLLKNP